MWRGGRGGGNVDFRWRRLRQCSLVKKGGVVYVFGAVV